jgi:hypothetical protein
VCDRVRAFRCCEEYKDLLNEENDKT